MTFNSRRDRYQMQFKLGQGGMGEVWLADDLVLQRPVAIKTINTTEQFYRDLFIQEARILAKLSHPNIVAVYDAAFDAASNQFYFVMEYVDGPTLHQHLRQTGALPLGIALDIALSILRGLQYAHTRGVVHRDIKPANIMLAGDDVKIADFGLADLAARLASGEGAKAGTVGYMPPEQAQGEPSDQRSDLYALGVVLFEMLTMQLPTRAEGSSPTHPTSLRTLLPNAPLMLEQALHHLLAPDPADRYGSSEELSNVLRTIRGQISRVETPNRVLATAPLVEREAELAQLVQLWEKTTQASHPHLAIVVGERGMGKHRLASELLRAATLHGAPCLSGLGDELQTPYQPFTEVLDALLKQRFDPKLLTPEAGASLISQMPRLGKYWPTPPALPPERSPQQLQRECFEAVAQLLTQAGPLVIYLQEVNMLDEASAALLSFLLRRGAAPTLLLVTTFTTEAITKQLSEGANPFIEEIRLQPLNAVALGAHLTQVFESALAAPVVRAVHQRSQGNLWYAEEIMRYWLQTQSLRRNAQGHWDFASDQVAQVVPPSLANVLKRQMDKLSSEQRNTLAVAAMLGTEFEFAAWRDALGQGTTTLLAVDALDRALSLGLVREVALDRYAFYPADIAQLLLEGLSAPRRRLLHQQIAEQFIQRQGDPLAVAHHLERAGATTDAARALETAASRAVNANAPHQAIVLYRRALQFHESAAAHEALGKLYRQTGQAVEARKTFQRAIELARQANDREAEGSAQNELAHVLWTYDLYKEAYQAAASVLQLPGVSALNLANACSHLGMVAWQIGRLTEAEDRCREALEILKANPDFAGGLDNAYNRLGLVLTSQGNFAEAEAMFHRAQELRHNRQDVWGEAYAIINRGRVALERGEFANAKTLLAQGRRLFEQVESPDGLMVADTNLGKLCLEQGQIIDALTHLTEAERLAEQIGKRSGYGLTEIYLYQAAAFIANEEPRLAHYPLDEALRLATTAGTQEYVGLGHAILARLAWVTGRLADAEAAYQKAVQICKQTGHRAVWIRAQAEYARFLRAQNQAARADTLAQTARAEAQRIGLYLPEK